MPKFLNIILLVILEFSNAASSEQQQQQQVISDDFKTDSGKFESSSFSTIASSSPTKVSSFGHIQKDWNLVLVGCITLGLVVFSTNHLLGRTKTASFFKTIMNGFSERFNSAINRSSHALGFNHAPSLASNDPSVKANYQLAMRLGGSVGGLVNDGNTCFMNSVLQCLASSNELMEFLERFTSEAENGDPETTKESSFSSALKELLTKLNSKHGNRSPTYKTRTLLKAMKDGPNKHLFLGYNQEDAQEFYQSVMKQVEKEFIGDENKEKTKDQKMQDKFIDYEDGMITGLNRLGESGYIYVPANQIDPSYPNSDSKVFPLKLITPVDGLQCERIGCTRCGEIGGIRYSVISGLGLNIPSTTQSSYQLSDLMDDWIEEEIIDGVECNRCGLIDIKATLTDSLKKYHELGETKMGKLIELTKTRIEEIELELAKPIIDDTVYEKLHTKNKVQKSQKTKQIYFSRPPPLLCIHVNRSVFDPRTYTVRKNNAKLFFPSKLNLTDYVAEPMDINMDARLPFRMQDETKESEEIGGADEQTTESQKTSLEDGESSSSEEDEDQKNVTDPYQQQIKSKIKNDDLTYSLKSVISHFGTHNYGHYIAYRKYRGVWWRISDEIVRISSEAEVLNSQGTFMLFYELSSRNDSKDEVSLDQLEVEVPVEQSDEENVSDDSNTAAQEEDTVMQEEPDQESNPEDELKQRELMSIQANL